MRHNFCKICRRLVPQDDLDIQQGMCNSCEYKHETTTLIKEDGKVGWWFPSKPEWRIKE